jgi:excisionase family DNA binding protein
MSDLAERVLTVPEAAQLLRVGERSVYAAVHRGELPAVRIGRRIVLPGAALQRLLDEGIEPRE